MLRSLIRRSRRRPARSRRRCGWRSRERRTSSSAPGCSSSRIRTHRTLDFKRWAVKQGAFARYPELSGHSQPSRFVPRSRLPAFEARAEADPVGPLGPHGTFAIVPAGVRPYYCFVTWSQDRGGPSQTPAGVDYCASDPQLIESRTPGRDMTTRSASRSSARHHCLLSRRPCTAAGACPRRSPSAAPHSSAGPES